MRKYIAAVLACLSLCALVLPALADNSAPVAENFEFETYRGVSFGGQLAAVDPEGDAVSFEITTQPKKGSIELSDDGSFVYCPEDGKRGRDYFGYKAIDADGNRSQEATVIIRLVKNKSVSYVDMGGNASYCSAVRLAECGAFIGKQIGGDYYFEPQKTLSRGEFTAMCLNVAGENVLRGVVKGREGAVFDAGADISRAEAAVMLDRLLSLADVSCADTAAVPTWAAQSAANLDACGIASLESVDNSPLTHAEAADMLAAAMTVLDKR